VALQGADALSAAPHPDRAACFESMVCVGSGLRDANVCLRWCAYACQVERRGTYTGIRQDCYDVWLGPQYIMRVASGLMPHTPAGRGRQPAAVALPCMPAGQLTNPLCRTPASSAPRRPSFPITHLSTDADTTSPPGRMPSAVT
jgi:hypothetical protein